MFLYQFRCSRCSKPFIRPLFPVRQSQCGYKSTRNHYDVLGVPHGASQEQIKNAYIELTKKYHPDKNSSKGSHEKFVEIRNAYSVLRTSSSRKDYDMQMKFSGHPHNHDAFRDHADPFDRRTGSYYRRNDTRDTPYWKQDPFREDYGYQHEQRKREQEYHRQKKWGSQWKRRQPDKTQMTTAYIYLFVQAGISTFIMIFIAMIYFAYTEHPERFKWKHEKDREQIEFLDRRSLKRLAEMEEASRNNRDYIAEDDER